mmetsp:Transcript_35021/g.107618  ORF Transcript_35021/g.107618 Transcript_35021/m.107618 type:complete len:83 (-) Transcript_35021:1424-1672(-)
MDASSESLNGVLPTSPMRDNAAASSGTCTMLTDGLTDNNCKPGGDVTTTLENNSWRPMMCWMHDCTFLGLAPPAIHTELETL